MNEVQVLPFELILRQDVATGSGNPLECLLDQKLAKNLKMHENMPPWCPPSSPWRCGTSLEGSLDWLQCHGHERRLLTV